MVTAIIETLQQQYEIYRYFIEKSVMMGIIGLII